MSLAFPVAAAVVAAACGWPASAVIAAFSARPEGADPVTAGTASTDARADGADGADRLSRDPGRTGPVASAQPVSRPAPALPWLAAAIMAGLAFAAAARLHPASVAVAACWLVICGLPLTVIDVRVRRLPDVLTGAAFAGVAVCLLTAAAVTGQWPALARAAGGGAAVGVLFAVLALARPGSAGLGDAKLGVSTGALAGWLGWGVLLLSVFAAFVLAAACGLGLVAAGRASLRSGSLPFGPFLLAGCLAIVLLAGPKPGY